MHFFLLLLRFTCCVGAALTLGAQPSGDRTRSGMDFDLGYAFGGDVSDTVNRTWHGFDVRHVGGAADTSWGNPREGRVSLGVEYDHFSLDLDPAVIPLPDDAQSIALELGYRRILNPRWTLQTNLKPEMATADGSWHSDGLGLSASVLGFYSTNESWTWIVGVVYRSLAEDDYRVLPAVGFEWRPTATWAAVLGFPRAGVRYTPNDRWALTFGAAAEGGTFYVDDLAAATPVGVNALRETLLDYTEIRVGLRAEHVAGLFGWYAEGGVIVDQEFDYFERDYKIESDEATPYVAAGIRRRF